jgi:hypothetical protein
LNFSIVHHQEKQWLKAITAFLIVLMIKIYEIFVENGLEYREFHGWVEEAVHHFETIYENNGKLYEKFFFTQITCIFGSLPVPPSCVEITLLRV